MDLPAANQASVYRRMQTQRQQIAAQTRAQGEQQKREIFAAADKEVAITLAIRPADRRDHPGGEGDAPAHAHLRRGLSARTQASRPFYRSMLAYEAGLGQGDTTMVLSPDSAFFKYFEQGPGGGAKR